MYVYIYCRRASIAYRTVTRYDLIFDPIETVIFYLLLADLFIGVGGIEYWYRLKSKFGSALVICELISHEQIP